MFKFQTKHTAMSGVCPSFSLEHRDKLYTSFAVSQAPKGGLGPSLLCSTGVFLLLGVIAASTGYDLAVVEGGILTHSVWAHRQMRLDSRVGGRLVIWEGS